MDLRRLSLLLPALALALSTSCASRGTPPAGAASAGDTEVSSEAPAEQEEPEQRRGLGFARMPTPGHEVYPGVTTWPPEGQEIKPYPFDTCAVIGKKLDGRTYKRYYQGYEVEFCCVPCRNAFEVHPEPWMPRIRAAHGDVAAESPAGDDAEPADAAGEVAASPAETLPAG